jgi:hypothetical protein
LRLNFHYIILIISIFAISCEEELTFEAQKFVPKIVLNSIFTNDSIWVIQLTHTTSVFQKEIKNNYIDDAVIAITDQNGFLACNMYHEGKGIYKSSGCTSSFEKNYKVSIYSKKYGSVEASSQVPSLTKVEDVKITTSNEIENATEIEFKILDKFVDKNYYIWSVVNVDTSTSSVVSNITSRLEYGSWITEIEEQFNTVSSGKLSYSTSVAGSELQYTNSITKLVTNNVFRKEGSEVSDEKNIVPMLKLMTVSPELYTYYKSMETYIKYNGTNTSVVEPQKLFTNIKGGLGIFAGYTIQYVPIKK